MNPAEAFVLGGAFLLHDLGMGLSAFPDSLSTIKSDPLFASFLAAAQERLASTSGLPEDSDKIATAAASEASVMVLRLRHARQAERLVLQDFTTSDGSRFKLMENTELRTAFGPMIGKIAHSHWFDVDQLAGEFDVKGSHTRHPANWEVDTLKIACVLRLSDAIHIDSRRAPTYLHAFRKPDGVSRDHWYFQERLTRPRLVGDRLTYTASQPFVSTEAKAWWLAFETIQMVDSELRRVDSLCFDTGRPQFLAKAVSGADSPMRLAKHIETNGWDPIDARVRVSQVQSVISSLGGKELYGDAPSIGLRELIANAADATRARNVQYGGYDNAVLVRMWKDGNDYWLSVHDNGIGMDENRLVSALTDFGKSSWASAEMFTDYPGLVTKGYKATGRFGIGFFSVFMLGNYVEVTSLRSMRGSEHTSQLVFEDGLSSRPLLRKVSEAEQLHQGGTVVKVKLAADPLSRSGLFEADVLAESRDSMLIHGLQSLCALSDVDIAYSHDQFARGEVVVRADEWKTMPSKKLFDTIYSRELKDPSTSPMYREYESLFVANLRNIYDRDGDIVGRAALAAGLEDVVANDVWWWPSPSASIFVGGLFADSLWSLMGVLVGEPLKADRRSAFPVATSAALRDWAEEQAGLIGSNRYASTRTRYQAAQLARSVNVDVPSLPCGYVNTGEINPAQLDDWVARWSEVLIIASFDLHSFHKDDGNPIFIDRMKGREIMIPDNAIVIDLFSSWFFPEERLPRPVDETLASHGVLVAGEWNPRAWWYRQGKIGSARMILESACRAWGVPLLELVDDFVSYALTDRGDSRMPVACFNSNDSIELEMFGLRRTASSSQSSS